MRPKKDDNNQEIISLVNNNKRKSNFSTSSSQIRSRSGQSVRHIPFPSIEKQQVYYNVGRKSPTILENITKRRVLFLPFAMFVIFSMGLLFQYHRNMNTNGKNINPLEVTYWNISNDYSKQPLTVNDLEEYLLKISGYNKGDFMSEDVYNEERNNIFRRSSYQEQFRKEQIENWCLRGEFDTSCKCENPLYPSSRHGTKQWSKAHHLNTEKALSVAHSFETDNKVMFYGDQIMEQWLGTRLSIVNAKKKDMPSIWKSIFGSTEKVIMAVSEDRSSNLFWRLIHGEMPVLSNTHSSFIFWISIGTNDFGLSWCKPEIVLIGILNVLIYLKEHNPHATIVINSILPRTFNSEGLLLKGEFPRKGKKRRRGGPSLFREIEAVNSALKLFSESESNIVFVNSTSIFIDHSTHGENLRLNMTLFDDHMMPNNNGMRIWAQQIKAILNNLL